MAVMGVMQGFFWLLKRAKDTAAAVVVGLVPLAIQGSHLVVPVEAKGMFYLFLKTYLLMHRQQQIK